MGYYVDDEVIVAIKSIDESLRRIADALSVPEIQEKKAKDKRIRSSWGATRFNHENGTYQMQCNNCHGWSYPSHECPVCKAIMYEMEER